MRSVRNNEKASGNSTLKHNKFHATSIQPRQPNTCTHMTQISQFQSLCRKEGSRLFRGAGAIKTGWGRRDRKPAPRRYRRGHRQVVLPAGFWGDLKSASKNQFFFKGGRGPRPQEVVQLPHSRRPAPSCQPARRVAAALRRRQRQLQQGLRAADGHGVHDPQLLHIAALRVEAPRHVRPRPARPSRRSVRSLLRWNLSALSWRTLNSVAGCFSTSSGAPCTVSWGRRPRPPAQSGRSTARPCAPPLWPGPSSASGCPGPPRRLCRTLAPSCAGLASQIKLSHIAATEKTPGADLVRAWCGPGAGSKTEAAEPASLQDRSRGAGLAPRPKPRSRPRFAE